ncbi:MAG: hypothetical protein LRY33_00605 [Parabacteroides chartae]|nr:hypothetical protein [Parabacteroides chartae]
MPLQVPGTRWKALSIRALVAVPILSFYNTETKESVFQPNPFKDNDEGVGVDVVEWIITFSCSKIVSGQFGMKIKPLLDESRIQLILVNDPELTIRQIINLLDH